MHTFDVNTFYGLLCPKCLERLEYKKGYLYCDRCYSYWDSVYSMKTVGDGHINEIELEEIFLDDD